MIFWKLLQDRIVTGYELYRLHEDSVTIEYYNVDMTLMDSSGRDDSPDNIVKVYPVKKDDEKIVKYLDTVKKLVNESDFRNTLAVEIYEYFLNNVKSVYDLL